MKNTFSKSTITVSLLTILALSVAAPASAHSVNKSVKIAAGNTSDGESSVNGSISVGSGAIVTGDLSTVNGRVKVDSDATVEDVSTVNGGLRIGSGSTTESLSTVNGGIAGSSDISADAPVDTQTVGFLSGSGVLPEVWIDYFYSGAGEGARTEVLCAGDTDASGDITDADVAAIYREFGTFEMERSSGQPNVNGDAVVDFQDVLAAHAALGACGP